MDRYWFNDNNRDDSWDAVWDVSVSRDRAGLVGRVPDSVLAAALQPVADEHVRLRGVARHRPAEGNLDLAAAVAQRQRLRVVVRRARRPRRWPRRSKRLELVPYMVTNLTRQPTDGNPLIKQSDPGAALGMDVKYALTPGLTFTGTVNPDFGQVEADPAVVNLTRVRDVLLRAAAVLRRRLRHLQLRSRLQRRRVHRAVLFAADRPVAAGHGRSRRRRRHLHRRRRSTRRFSAPAKLTGRVGSYSIGVMQAFTQEELARVQNGVALTRTPVEPLDQLHGRPCAARVREPVVDRGHAHRDEAQLGERPRVPARHGADVGGVDWDLRFKKRYSLTGYLVGSDVRGEPEAITAHPGEQPPLLPAARPDERVARLRRARSLTGGAGSDRHQQDRRRARPVQLERRLQVARASTSTTSGSCAAPTSASMGNWLQIRSDTPNQLVPQPEHQFQSVRRRGTSTATGCSAAATSTRTSRSSTTGAWAAATTSTPSNSTTAPRAAARASTSGGFRTFWSLPQHRHPPAAPAQLFHRRRRQRRGADLRRFRTRASTYRPMPALTITTGVRVSNRTRYGAQWVENVTDASDHYVFGELDQTTVAITPRLNYTMTPNLSLQLYAEPFVSAGDYGAFKELVNGRSRDYDGALRAVRVHYARRRPELQREVVPDDERAAVGIQARLDAVRRLAAGARERGGARRLPLRPRRARHLRRRRRGTCSSSSSRTG